MDWIQSLGRAVDYIEKNLRNDVDTIAAARCAGIAVNDFQRLFTRIVGQSMNEYTRARRLICAADDLRNSKRQIIDIALEHGYESSAAFSRAFKTFHGVTPTEARQGSAARVQPAISFKIIVEEWYRKMNKFSERGYVVRETGPIYHTLDMSATAKWFREVLGWSRLLWLCV